MAIIEVAGVTKEYPRGITSLKDVSVTIEAGEFVYVLGASGSGKSTFIKLLYRDIMPTKGTITVCGHNVGKMNNHIIHHLRRDIGIVFQDCKLLTGKTVFENIAFALEVTGEHPEEISDKVYQSLKTVGLSDKANSYPDQLSGGEKQRVAIARAVVHSPKIILADEPTGNLDPRTSLEIFRLLYKINLSGTTVLMATHDQGIIENFRFRILEMKDGCLIKDLEKKQKNTLQYDFKRKEYFIV
jgi:cell division transport system ATP-binding protein